MTINTFLLFEAADHPAGFIASNLAIRAPFKLVDLFPSKGLVVSRQLGKLLGFILGKRVDFILYRLLLLRIPVVFLIFYVALRLVRLGRISLE